MIFVYKINGIWFISNRQWYKFYVNSGMGKFGNYPDLTHAYLIETLGM